MSKLAKSIIELIDKTECKIEKDNILVAKGAKGLSILRLSPGIVIEIEDKKIIVKKDNEKISDAILGLNWALVNNLIIGVSKGFEKRLTLIGVGFRASVQGKKLDLKVGYSHPTALSIPEEIDIKVEKSTEIIISGKDKQKVGQFAAEIRAVKPPEPYKGKGIRYKDEYVRRKAGKSAKAAAQ